MSNDAVILVLVVSVIWLVGLGFFIRWHTQLLFVERVRRQWARTGRDIHYLPVATTYYGSEPRQSHANVTGSWGVLGLADQQLVFIERASHLNEFIIDFEAIRWIGVRTITVRSGKYVVQKPALIVHYEAVDPRTNRLHWYVAAFETAQCYEVAEVLSQQAGLAFYKMGTAREDHGPADATRMLQDIYGQWQPDFSDKLYLAPDRLLFAWRNPILLADVQRVEVIDTPGLLDHLNPLAQDLLRIDFAAADGTTQVVGFHMMFARKWGETIAERAGVPLTIHEGRKKKGA